MGTLSLSKCIEDHASGAKRELDLFGHIALI